MSGIKNSEWETKFNFSISERISDNIPVQVSKSSVALYPQVQERRAEFQSEWPGRWSAYRVIGIKRNNFDRELRLMWNVGIQSISTRNEEGYVGGENEYLG